jgi:hypothetical protein
MSTPKGQSVTVASLEVDGIVDLTAGDDPNVIWNARAGAVSGTFMASGAGGSVSASFFSPYCKFSGCP